MKMATLTLNLDQKKVGGFKVKIKHEVEGLDLSENNFCIYLVHPSGQLTLEPVAVMTYSSASDLSQGRLCLRYSPFAIFEGTAIEKQCISIAGSKHEQALFKLISDQLEKKEIFKIEYALDMTLLPAKAEQRDAREILLKLVYENNLKIINAAAFEICVSNDNWREGLACIETVSFNTA
jgi:hypothetical protein